MFARIENGQIAELMDVKKLPPLHPEIAGKFVNVPATAQEGDTYDHKTGKTSKPQISKADREKRIDDDANSLIQSAYPIHEQLEDIRSALQQIDGVALPARAVAMQSFIDDTKAAGKAAAQAGKKAKNIKWPAAPNV